jgi:hypothetical protein
MSHKSDELAYMAAKRAELSIWERALGWRKRQMIEADLNRDHTNIRNQVLEEVAREFEKMKVFEADTMASFAIHIREMKR